MRVLMVHNYYRIRGGECESFECEAAGLEALGCQVRKVSSKSGELSRAECLLLPLRQAWSFAAQQRLEREIVDFRPDIIHFQNTFPLFSRSCYYVAARRGIPVVQTLHNYRFLCANALLARKGRVCEECLGRQWPWPAVRHRCYKNSMWASFVVAAGNVLHNKLGSNNMPHVYFLTASEFARSRFIKAGWDASRIRVKPNLIPKTLIDGEGEKREGIIYVGRLSEEKGIVELLQVWSECQTSESLHIVGDGELRALVEEAAARDSRIHYHGLLPLQKVIELVARCRLLVLLSNCYETFGRSLGEAISVGTPVLATEQGALAEIAVASGGFTVPTNDVLGARKVIEEVLSLSNLEWKVLSQKARQYYYEKLHPDLVNRQLLEIYADIIKDFSGKRIMPRSSSSKSY